MFSQANDFPTLWYQSCSKIDLEVDEFLELGPGKVLAGLNRSIGLNKPIKSLGTVESINNFYQGYSMNGILLGKKAIVTGDLEV